MTQLEKAWTVPVAETLFNPDSAVAIYGKREAQSFRSKVDGLVPLSK